MGTIAKKFNQLKQWTGERFGQERRTEASDEFKDMAAQTEQRKEGIEKLHLSLLAYLKTFEKKKARTLDPTETRYYPLELLGSTMIHQSKMIGPDCLYGEALSKAGEIQKGLCAYQNEFNLKVRRSYLSQLDRLLDLLKEYQYFKKKLGNRRLDYDAKLNRLQRSKKEKPRLEEEVKTAKLKYEETTEDLENLMRRIVEREKELASGLFDFIEAQAEYFERTCESLKVGKGELFAGGKPRQAETDSPQRVWSRDSGEETSEHEPAGSDDSSSLKKPPVSAFKVRVLYDYDPNNKDELPLKKGDVLTVYDEFNDGWWTGCNERDELGMFPSNYVERLEESTEDTLVQELQDHLRKPRSPIVQPVSEQEVNEPAAPACSVCGCSDFCANVFKAHSCNNCFHSH